jgi:hypothetical protein
MRGFFEDGERDDEDDEDDDEKSGSEVDENIWILRYNKLPRFSNLNS